MCPGVDSASKNEYQDIPGGKGGRCVRVTTLPPSCAECLVIWSLNRPEPSGPHRPVIGIALPLPMNIQAQTNLHHAVFLHPGQGRCTPALSPVYILLSNTPNLCSLCRARDQISYTHKTADKSLTILCSYFCYDTNSWIKCEEHANKHPATVIDYYDIPEYSLFYYCSQAV